MVLQRIFCAVLAALVVFGASRFCAAAPLSEAALVFSGELDSTAFETAVAQDREVRISYSPGGSGAAAIALTLVKAVVIDGACASACAWAFVMGDNVCFTSNAVFKFHAAHDPGTGQRITIATDYWLSLTTPSLRPALKGLRTSSKLIEISARTMKLHYGERACDGTGHRQRPDAQWARIPAALHAQSAVLRRLAIPGARLEAAAASLPVGIATLAALALPCQEMPVIVLATRDVTEPLLTAEIPPEIGTQELKASIVHVEAHPTVIERYRHWVQLASLGSAARLVPARP